MQNASAAAIQLSGSMLLGRVLSLSYSAKAAPPSSSGRRSIDAKQRRKAKREEQRQRSAGDPERVARDTGQGKAA